MHIKKDWFIISLAFFLATLALYGYYFLTNRFTIVYQNWDGPSYVMAAQSLYDPVYASEHNFLNVSHEHLNSHFTYLPAHFPLYPIFIRAFSFIGYFQSALFVSVVFSLLYFIAFYELARGLKFVNNPLLLTLPMILLTPRWFLVSHVAGSESMFLFFLTLGLVYWQKQKIWPSAVAFGLAQITRPQGALIALAIGLYALYELVKSRDLKKIFLSYYPYLLIPLSLILVFTFYYLRTGDFFAFFSAIAIFKHFDPVPFSTFAHRTLNVETYWQEINALDYVLYLTAIFFMFKKKLASIGTVGFTLFIPLIFLHHSDISRYALPMLPILFLGFSEIIETKEFNLATLAMSPAIIRYCLDFMEYNHAA